MEKGRRARLLLLAALAAASPAVAVVAPVRVPQVRVAPSFKLSSTLPFQSAARGLVPTLPLFTPRTQEAFQAASLQLSPDNAGKLSGEQAKGLSTTLFDQVPKLPSFSEEPVLGSFSNAFSLDRPGESGVRSRESVPQPSGASSRTGDWLRHAQLYLKNLHWYTVTHVRSLWPQYAARRRAVAGAGLVPSVSRPRAFFAHMRMMGATGPFYVLGFVPREDEGVIAEARVVFRRYFRGAGKAERRSFDDFLGRALGYNAERRALTNMRKHVRDALLEASLLPVSGLSGYFDGLLRDDATAGASEFQHGGQEATLARLRETVLAALSAEDATAADRVVGVILLGSFARGGATPTSDIDLQAITADGTDARVPRFSRRLKEAWTALGLQKSNPVSVQDFAFYPSKGLIGRVHYSTYLVIAADPSLEAALNRREDEPLPAPPARTVGWKGRLWRAFQFSVVYTATFGR